MTEIDSIINRFCRKDVGRISEGLDLKKNITVTGIEDSAKPLLINKLLQSFEDTPSKLNRAVFWFTDSGKEAETLSNQISFWSTTISNQQSTIILPIFDEDVLERAQRVELYNVLYKLINNAPAVYFTPIASLAQQVPSLSAFSKNLLTIHKDNNFDLENLTAKLTGMGYTREGFAAEAGLFTIKGDVLDIFPINSATPIRIESLGNEIENMHTFDPKTKNKINDIEKLDVVPIDIPDKTYGKLLDYIEFNRSINEEQLYFLNEPTSLKESLEFIEPKLWKTFWKLTARGERISFEALPNEESNVIKLDYQKAPVYYYDLKKFQQEVQDKLILKWNYVFVTKNKDKIENLLSVDSPFISYIDHDKDDIDGFISRKNKFAVITDKEIFGIQIAKKRKKDIKFISELSEGDFIVHYDHGIGKFIGMTRRDIDEGTREFFVLEYAKRDKLFLPVEYSEKITKYIGAAHPKIHRLHEASWSQVRAKIKEKAEIIARELVALYAAREIKKGFKFSKDNDAMASLYASFPYTETEDQARVWNEVKNDMEKKKSEKPMDRLVCGDVGFGKTEIAIRAAVKAVQDEKQVALLGPTTILAQQHYDTFVDRLQGLDIKVDVLSRFKTTKEQLATVEKLNAGQVDIVIGTHRLLSQDIKYQDLGLLIIDEEQKFGVRHKERIKEFKANVDVLTLTATPIPRTLNLSLSGLRDISTIETPPEGRRSVKTIIQKHSNDTIKKAIDRELDRNGQVYYLHNRVATIQSAARKVGLMFPKASVDVAHGQLAEGKLADVMHRFDQGKIDILVSSSIIENGLDLPNANTLIVSKSTNFGLSSLYQLRGRIGRSRKKAYAYFLYHEYDLKEMARKRLQALLEAKELGAGFKLALRDLEIRGVGNILGKQQSGNVTAVGLNLYTRLLNKAVKEIKTGVKTEEFDVSIDLPLSAFIPTDFIESKKKRIFTYQEIAGISDLEELNEYKIELLKRLKRDIYPKTLENLFYIIELKILCRDSKIANIDTKIITRATGEQTQKLVLTPKGKVDYIKAKRLLEHNADWEVHDSNIKIDIEDLGREWKDEIKKSLEIMK